MLILGLQFCNIKKIFTILVLLLSVQVTSNAVNTDGLCLITVTDSNNEKLSGAAIEISGTNKVYYTNINGACYIPKSVLSNAELITVNCISYKSLQLSTDNLHNKIVLKSR